MARVAEVAAPTRAAAGQVDVATSAVSAQTPTEEVDREKVLPLPGWLVKVYFIFPLVLYIPDAIFNYYVYTDGFRFQDSNPLFQVGYMVLWGFVSLGVVGMAYLLSVLAPWHWGQGHRIQAFFCALGVLVATAITTWNSLAYRSKSFVGFETDKWAYQIWPQLSGTNISITMILVAIAPPFWGLFWAIVQPTETGRSLRQLQESHAERMLRMEQEAELKRLRAETNAKIREAQLRGMARTAATVREQAAQVLTRGAKGDSDADTPANDESQAPGTAEAQPDGSADHVLKFPPLRVEQPGRALGRGTEVSLSNHAAPATAPARMGPNGMGRGLVSQPALLSDVDVTGHAGTPASDTDGWATRRPPTLFQEAALFGNETGEPDAMTGTTGPRPAIRRPGEPSSLLRTLNEGFSPEIAQVVNAAFKELAANSSSGRVSQKDWAALVADRLGVDASRARQVIQRVREHQRVGKA